jgi:carboxymethylenebutenolidase
MKGRILCLFGENDGYIPATDVAAIRKALEAAKVRHEVVVYPGVGHGFFCDVRGDYDAKSAADAWERVKKLFREELA